jgi:hypothetical protein
MTALAPIAALTAASRLLRFPSNVLAPFSSRMAAVALVTAFPFDVKLAFCFGFFWLHRR